MQRSLSWSGGRVQAKGKECEQGGGIASAAYATAAAEEHFSSLEVLQLLLLNSDVFSPINQGKL